MRVWFPFKRGLVVSFPKSGRTWLRVMLDELGVKFHYSHGSANHPRRLPFDSLPPPARVMAGRRTVFLHRDPRDTAVSGFFHATKRMQIFDGSLSEFIRDPRYGIEKVVRFNSAWLAATQGRTGAIIIRYEEMRADPAGELRRVLHFLGKHSDGSAIDRAVAAGSFEVMQSREAQGQYRERYGRSLDPRDPTDLTSFKVRRGKVGGWRDYLSDEDIAYCTAVMLEHGSSPARWTG